MNHHKQSILSKSPNFWFQLKSLFFKSHGHAEAFRLGNVNPLTLIPYNTKPNVPEANQWQAKRKLLHENAISDAQKWRNDWSRFITSEIGSYTHTPGKGINDITVNLTNKTSVRVDYIQVKVLYLKEDGKLYKSEYAELFDVSPLSTSKLQVYSSPVGSTLKVYITNVVATALNLAFSQDSYQ
jgi:hypothetical protein